MSNNPEEEDFLINIVEELDDDDNVKNFKLEKINGSKNGQNSEQDFLAHKLQLDFEAQRKKERNDEIDKSVIGVKEKLDYKKGFLNSLEINNQKNKENMRQEQQATNKPDRKRYITKTQQIEELKKDISKSEEIGNITPKENKQVVTAHSPCTSSSGTEQKQDTLGSNKKGRKAVPTNVSLCKKKYSSLFLPSKNKKKMNKKSSLQTKNPIDNEEKPDNIKSRFTQNLANEKKIMFATTKKNVPVRNNHVASKIISTSPVENTELDNKIGTNSVENDNADADYTVTENIKHINKKIYEDMVPQIATEDIYEICFDEDDIEKEKNFEEEDLVLEYDEEELYKRVFPWLKFHHEEIAVKRKENDANKKDTEINSKNEEEEIAIEGVDFYDEEDDRDSIGWEKPIIDEKVLESVKDKLVYEIDNDRIEIINDSYAKEEVEQIEGIADSSTYLDQKGLKPSLKKNSSVSSYKQTKVNFSNIVKVKEIENKEQLKQQYGDTDSSVGVDLYKIQEKLKLDKMYKDIFGDDYTDIQKQIIDNMKSFGFDSPLDVEIPAGFSEKEEKLKDYEDEEVMFEDIVSTNIVERPIVSQDFQLPAKNMISNNKSEKLYNLTMTNDQILLERNTRENKFV